MLCIISVQWYCLGRVKAEKVGVYCLLHRGMLRSQRLQSPELDGLCSELGYHQRGLLGWTSYLCTLKVPLCLSSATGWTGEGTGPSAGLREWEGGWGTSFSDWVQQLEGVGPCLKWVPPRSRGHFKCLLSYSHLRVQFKWMWSQQKC